MPTGMEGSSIAGIRNTSPSQDPVLVPGERFGWALMSYRMSNKGTAHAFDAPVLRTGPLDQLGALLDRHKLLFRGHSSSKS